MVCDANTSSSNTLPEAKKLIEPAISQLQEEPMCPAYPCCLTRQKVLSEVVQLSVRRGGGGVQDNNDPNTTKTGPSSARQHLGVSLAGR